MILIIDEEKRNMKRIVIGLLFLSPGFLKAIPDLAFVDQNFDLFVGRVVTSKRDQQNFKVYYERLTEKIAETDENKRRATRQYLYQIALDNLQKKHAAWYEEISHFFSDVKFSIDESFDPVRAHVRQFLRWYGAYEEYLTAKMLAQHTTPCEGMPTIVLQENENKKTVWDKTKDFAHKTKDKIAGVFRRKKETQLV